MSPPWRLTVIMPKLKSIKISLDFRVNESGAYIPEWWCCETQGFVCRRDEAVNVVSEATRGKLWHIIASERLAVHVIELGEVDITA